MTALLDGLITRDTLFTSIRILFLGDRFQRLSSHENISMPRNENCDCRFTVCSRWVFYVRLRDTRLFTFQSQNGIFVVSRTEALDGSGKVGDCREENSILSSFLHLPEGKPKTRSWRWMLPLKLAMM